MANLFQTLPEDHLQEHFEPLLVGSECLLERIVSFGQATKPGEWLVSERDEWVMLLVGAAELAFADPARRSVLVPGDTVFLPAGCRHRVEHTAQDVPSIWLALHLPSGAMHEAPAP